MNNKSNKKQFGKAKDTAPEWIDRQAKSFWKRFTPALLREGILNEATYELVASMCQAFSVYLDCVQRLRVEGRVITSHTGAAKVNPLVAVEKQAWEQFVRGFKELKIAGEPMPTASDELEAFLTEPETGDVNDTITYLEKTIEAVK